MGCCWSGKLTLDGGGAIKHGGATFGLTLNMGIVVVVELELPPENSFSW